MTEFNPDFPVNLLSRVEDAGLNASAPPQQRWLDGWLLRLSPGKAKRARCINAVAEGRLPIEQRLHHARRAFVSAGLPMIVRITPFTQPPHLDEHLAAQGFHTLDDTRVMVCPTLSDVRSTALPDGCRIESLGPVDFAEQVGGLRGSPPLQRLAHAERLANSPVQFHGFAMFRGEQVLACGQYAIEDELVGLYDVFTAEAARGEGHAQALCRAILVHALNRGARTAYLQVEGDNAPARAIYHRLGFADGYAYHYRSDDPEVR